MGCTQSNININVKTKDMANIVINLFAELLEEDLYAFDDNEVVVMEKEDGFWINIDQEPLFETYEEGLQIKYFVKEFVKRFPDEYFYLDNTESFNNCGDTSYYEYKYNEKLKELFIRSVYSEYGGLYICPECDEDFDGEPLVYIEDYKEGETYVCPLCGAEITFDADEVVEVLTLEDIMNE